MESVEDLVRRRDVMRRDEQALWLAQYLVSVEIAALEACGWYRGEAAAKCPETPLSEHLHPGNDGEQGVRHRLYSLAKTMNQYDPMDTVDFKTLRATFESMLDALAAIQELSKIERIRGAFRNHDAYLIRMSDRKAEDKEFAKRNMEFAVSMAELFAGLAEDFCCIEAECRGLRPDDPFQERQIALQEETAANVEKLLRRGRQSPVSMTASIWAHEKWVYYNQHPEALKRDVARRRITHRDVWDAVRVEAIARGFPDYESFHRALRSYDKRAKAAPARPFARRRVKAECVCHILQ